MVQFAAPLLLYQPGLQVVHSVLPATDVDPAGHDSQVSLICLVPCKRQMRVAITRDSCGERQDAQCTQVVAYRRAGVTAGVVSVGDSA